MKNKILQTGFKMLIALIVGLFFYFTKESEHYLISFIGLGISLILSILVYQKTFPILMLALGSLFICSYMQLFKVNTLFSIDYQSYFTLGIWMLIIGFVFLFIEEIKLIFYNEKIN